MCKLGDRECWVSPNPKGGGESSRSFKAKDMASQICDVRRQDALMANTKLSEARILAELGQAVVRAGMNRGGCTLMREAAGAGEHTQRGARQPTPNGGGS